MGTHPRLARTQVAGCALLACLTLSGLVHLLDAARLVSRKTLKVATHPVQSTIGATGPQGHFQKYHVLTIQGAEPAEGKTVYQKWQMRVHFYWYLKTKAQCEQQLGDACEMGGFTRILANNQPDDLMDEIPTFLAFPVNHDYRPNNKPYGLMQWLVNATIPEQYVFVCETDNLFLRPLPNFMRDVGDGQIVAYPTDVIHPSAPKNLKVLAEFMPSKKLNVSEAATITPVGCSAFFATVDQLRKIVPLYYDFSERMHTNPLAVQVWQWVREMYAFVLALHLSGVGPVHAMKDLVGVFRYDENLEVSPGRPWYMAHYSAAAGYTRNGTFTANKTEAVWRWAKGNYMDIPPPRTFPLPPTNVKNELVRLVIRSIVEATQNIPCWDSFAKTKRRAPTCDEVIPGSVYPRPPRST